MNALPCGPYTFPECTPILSLWRFRVHSDVVLNNFWNALRSGPPLYIEKIVFFSFKSAEYEFSSTKSWPVEGLFIKTRIFFYFWIKKCDVFDRKMLNIYFWIFRKKFDSGCLVVSIRLGWTRNKSCENTIEYNFTFCVPPVDNLKIRTYNELSSLQRIYMVFYTGV